ncbi:MAG: hypothetical protein AAFY76_24590 [Cyanobacteria bacterium J06649_11]
MKSTYSISSSISRLEADSGAIFGYDLINIESIEGEWFGIYKEDIYLDDSLNSVSRSENIVSTLQTTGAETNALAIGIGIIADAY